MILEPGQRRQMRFAPVGPREARERVYRVTVKPVAGPLSAAETGLKLLVGYDVLVLLRPADLRSNLVARRVDGRLTFRNEGNASLELIDGRQCVAGRNNCTPLPGKRLYAGAEWSQELPSTHPSTIRSSRTASRRAGRIDERPMFEAIMPREKLKSRHSSKSREIPSVMFEKSRVRRLRALASKCRRSGQRHKSYRGFLSIQRSFRSASSSSLLATSSRLFAQRDPARRPPLCSIVRYFEERPGRAARLPA